LNSERHTALLRRHTTNEHKTWVNFCEEKGNDEIRTYAYQTLCSVES
jgi:hypothetical protein